MKKIIVILTFVASTSFMFQRCKQNEDITPTATDTVASSSARGGVSESDKGTSTTKTVVTQANLLAAISTYLNTKYSGYTFGNAYSETVSGVIVNYDVNITHNSVNYHVVFDANGVFVGVSTMQAGGKGSSTTNVAVTQANLLAAITTYLNSNYSGYTFGNAYSEAVSGVIVNYDVNITYNNIAYHVVFDAKGVFVGASTRVAKGKTSTTNTAVTQANLLAAISTYLTTNYSGYVFVNAYSEAVNGTIVNYDVNITHGGFSYHVEFTATGTFVSVKKK